MNTPIIQRETSSLSSACRVENPLAFPATKITLLLAVTNPSVRTLLDEGLTRAGYGVHIVESGHELFACLVTTAFNLILLHTELANTNVFELCAKLREESYIPLFLLSEQKNQNHMIDGLALGADDYITLPVTLAELDARLRATLRRAGYGKYPYQTENLPPSIFLNNQNRTVQVRDEEISLTQIEFRMLYYLMHHANVPVAKEHLIEAVWGYANAEEVNFIEVAIRRLRQKIELNPSKPEYLVTVRGSGYQLNLNPRASRIDT